MSVFAIFTFLPFAFFALTLGTFVWRHRMSVRARLGWTVALAVAFSKFLGFRVFGGHAFTPELPVAVIWTWDFLYSGAMILSALSLLTVFFGFRAKLWLLPIVAWGLAAKGLYNGFTVPEAREVTLEYSDLPVSLDGYRIVHLSDLHCSSAARRWRTEAVVERVNALSPDLVCITGDLADGRVGLIAPFLEPIGRLRARDGVFACTGNHEYHSDYPAWRDGFYSKLTNLRFLENECVFPHEGLALAGIPDAVGDAVRGTACERAWWRSFDAATNGEFRVVMAHQPKTVTMNVRECDVRLQLSGHTHGGVAPGISAFVAVHNDGYVRGLYSVPGRKGEGRLYVSPGTGQWGGFPMRFFNDSEITVLVLRRR